MEPLLDSMASERDYWRLSESLELELSVVEVFNLEFKVNLIDIRMDYKHDSVGELVYHFDDKSKYTFDEIFYSLYGMKKKNL